MKLHESFLGGGYLTGSSSMIIFGCTDANSSNYNPNATNDDNSCIQCIYGCTNASSTNYDPLATCDDGTCIVPIYGCMDVNAFNYNPNANVNEVSDQNAADPCVPIVYGCVDVNSFNYDPSANTDDGSCVAIVYGCTDSLATNYDPNANTDDGSCSLPYYNCSVGASNLTFNETITQPGNTSSSVYVTIGASYNVTPVNNIYLQNNNSPVQYQDFTFSSFLVQYKICGTGLLTNVNVPASSVNIVENLDLSASSCYEFIITASCDYTGNAGYIPPATAHVYSLQVNTPALIPVLGCTDLFALNYDSNANTDDGSCDYNGCTDPNATNYDANATIDDGSCSYSPIYGCNDSAYVNYNSTATVACDSGDPNQASENWNCTTPGPNCCCGDLIYYGCTDPTATNQDPNANTLCTDSNDLLQNNNGQPCTECIYPFQVGCTDSTAGDNPDINGYCNDGDGWPTYNNSTFVGVGVLGGCTLNSPPIAGYNVSNYNPEAVQDTTPSSCTTPGFGCTDDTSCSYNVNATSNPFNACASPSGFCPQPSNANVTLGSNPFEEIIVTFTPECTIIPGVTPNGHVEVSVVDASTNTQVAGYGASANFQSGQTIAGLTQNTNYNVLLFTNCPLQGGATSSALTLNITTQQVLTPGCTDPTANNFDTLANTPCTSCTGNNVPNCCCTYDVLGCTDPSASNYNSSANVDDGSCLIDGCMDPNAINYDPTATNDVGCAYCPDIQAVTGQTVIDGNTPPGTAANNPITGRLSMFGTYSSMGGTAIGWRASLGNIYVAGASNGQFVATEDLNWQALAPGIHRISAIYSTTPITDPSTETFANYSQNQINNGWTDPGNIQFKGIYHNSNGNFSVGGMPGGHTMYLYLMTHCDPNELPNTTTTSIPPSSTVSMTPIEFLTPDVSGCTDSTALNYNPNANINDGSCSYPTPSCSDPITSLAITGWTEYTGVNSTNEVGYYPTFEWQTPSNAINPPNQYALLLDEIILYDTNFGFTSINNQGKLALTDLSVDMKQSAYDEPNAEGTGDYGNSFTTSGSGNNYQNYILSGNQYNTLVGFVSDSGVNIAGYNGSVTNFYGGFFAATSGEAGHDSIKSASMVNRYNLLDANGTNTYSSFLHANNAWSRGPLAITNPNNAQNRYALNPTSNIGLAHIEGNATAIVRATVVPDCGLGYETVNDQNVDVDRTISYVTPAPCIDFDITDSITDGWKNGDSDYPYPHPVKVVGIADNAEYDPNVPTNKQVGVIVRFQINNGCHWGSYEVPKMELHRKTDSNIIDYSSMMGKISFDPYNNGNGNHIKDHQIGAFGHNSDYDYIWNPETYVASNTQVNKVTVNAWNRPNGISGGGFYSNTLNATLYNPIDVRKVDLHQSRCAAYFNLVIPLSYLGGLSHFGVNTKQDFLSTYYNNLGSFGGVQQKIMDLDNINDSNNNFYGIQFNYDTNSDGLKRYCWNGSANTYDSNTTGTLNESGTVYAHSHQVNTGFRLKWGNLNSGTWMP